MDGYSHYALQKVLVQLLRKRLKDKWVLYPIYEIKMYIHEYLPTLNSSFFLFLLEEHWPLTNWGLNQRIFLVSFYEVHVVHVGKTIHYHNLRNFIQKYNHRHQSTNDKAVIRSLILEIMSIYLFLIYNKYGN